MAGEEQFDYGQEQSILFSAVFRAALTITQ
jgi:hypothetical protein